MTITDKQKELLRKLDTAIIKIIEETNQDENFKEFINTLNVFDLDYNTNLLEISDILIDNYNEEQF